MNRPRANGLASLLSAGTLALALCAALPPPARAEGADAGQGGEASTRGPAGPDARAADDSDDELDFAPPPAPRGRGSISESVGTIQPDSTAQDPAGAMWLNKLIGIIDLNERWSLDLELLYSVQEGTPPPAGSNFGGSGGHVSLFTLGADWDSGEHWSFDLLGEVSPRSSTTTSTDLTTQLSSTGANTTTDARLLVTSSNADLELGAGYDTAGLSDLEWLFAGSATLGHLDTDQRVTAVEDRATMRPVTTSALASYCALHPRICGKALDSALQDRDYPLDSLKLEAGATATLFRATDLRLTGDYFAYQQDPSQVGYFNLATSGRSLSGGAGVPVAPLRFQLRLDLIHRFGPLSLKLWGSAGEYAIDGAFNLGAGVRAQLKLGRAWSVFASVALQHDETDVGDELFTWLAGAGFGYRF